VNRVAFCTLSIGAIVVALLVPFRLDSPLGRTQVLPGLNGRGQRIVWPKRVRTARVVLDRLAVQHVPHAAGLLALQGAVSARSANAFPSPRPGGDRLAPITVDYPAEGSIFPPDISPPRFIWRDAREDATVWLIDVSFSDGSGGIQVKSKGERLRIGEIDQRCIAESNKLPELTPQEAASRIWAPDAATWASIKKHSVERPATVTITGFRDENATQAVSRGQRTIETSKDPVGAPIFYRDVPLIPGIGEKGVIKPLPESAVHLIKWRLRYVGDSESRTMMQELPTCANCHSFSRDGKTLGMDVDGPQNDKGLYSLTPIKPETSIRSENVIKWTSFRALEDSDHIRVGFMSQVSPDGRYVVTMINDPRPKQTGSGLRPQDRIYVANFTDYRFGQVFFPTRGILAWYDREARQLRPLPGADDPRYVQTAGFWSPDGKYIVFERAEAKDPFPEGAESPKFANDPNEAQMHYDLYRIPFNDGRGGVPEPIAGASQNGMSNNFPKVSPDGRWIVFVKCRNALLMRPDSQLYIVPARGGVARRLRCNTALMNSWHSFSPNGHWLVFSSKSRSPYTQMFLTHIDADGNDSPSILIDNATAANRAVNIPEFVNIPPDGMMKIDVPAAESYRLFDIASDLTAKGYLEPAIAAWRKVLELDPRNAKAHNNLGLALMWQGNLVEGTAHLQKAREVDPSFGDPPSDFGVTFFNREQFNAAMQKSDCDAVVSYGNKILAVAPGDADVKKALAKCELKVNSH